MSISRRQSKEINKIIQEELQRAMSGRSERDVLLRRGEIQERLVEDGSVTSRVDLSIMDRQVSIASEEINDVKVENLVFSFRQKLGKVLADVINQHSLSMTRVDPKTFMNDMEQLDQDIIMEASQKCVSDIMLALENYAKELGELAVNLAGDEDEEY